MKGTLLTAVGHDANNQIYPVAWFVVQTENGDKWLWFIKHLKADLGLQDGSGYVMISDRCKVSNNFYCFLFSLFVTCKTLLVFFFL